ncbi:MAG TPA: hypothetical protein VLA83_11085 [Candidatus Binatia bacterium]|nr:hypothetical protein [Candidatus Binatia bacterium]
MQADFSVELGGDFPALEIPWRSDDPNVRFYDLKNHPELVLQIPEARAYPELASFLGRINAPGFPLATAKCDVWSSNEVSPEEEIFGDRKFISYVDLILVDEKDRYSFEKNEAFAQELCRLLGHAPEIAATVDLVIRHCYYHDEFALLGEQGQSSPQESEKDDFLHFDDLKTPPSKKDRTAPSQKSGRFQQEPNSRREGRNNSVRGFCITSYVTGFGDSDQDPVRRWTIGLNLLQHAIVQLSAPPKH